MINKTLAIALMGLLGLAGCSDSDSSGDAGAIATTYTLSGNMSQGQSSASLSSVHQLKSILGLSAKTQCADSFFYSVYCLSFSTPPVAAEGDVDCAGSGAFSVEGLPKGEAIGCFIRRFDPDTPTVAETVGAIQIPASNLNGSTEQMVANGDVAMNVEISNDGKITASVVSGSVNDSVDDTAASTFTPSNINGIWELKCDSTAGGSAFDAGLCKCFLGEGFYSEGGYNNQDECLADKGAGITSDVTLGVDMSIYPVTVQQQIDNDGGKPIPAGTELSAISLWGTTGNSLANYVSVKTGGEGVTTLGGALSWDTSVEDPTQVIAWTTSVDPDGAGPVGTMTIPTVPTPTANHAAWVQWMKDVTTEAAARSWSCTVPGSTPTQPANHIDCLNRAMELLSQSDAVLPQVHLNPFCDQGGCRWSTHTGQYTAPEGHANAFLMARLYVDGLDFRYDNGTQWSETSNYSTLVSEGGIGIEPENRYVFEPLEFFPNGAGFRQTDNDERHFSCGLSTSDSAVQNNACDVANEHAELVCHTREELAIKFLTEGTTISPMNVIFDQHKSIAFAELVRHTSNGRVLMTPLPAGTTAIDMCKAKLSSQSATFFATGTKKAN